MLELLADPQVWLAFITLSTLEIILGIDNLIFIAILVGRLPPARQEAARLTGLTLAMLTRIALLYSIVWLTRLTTPWFHVGTQAVTGRDVILFIGGLFLRARARGSGLASLWGMFLLPVWLCFQHGFIRGDAAHTVAFFPFVLGAIAVAMFAGITALARSRSS